MFKYVYMCLCIYIYIDIFIYVFIDIHKMLGYCEPAGCCFIQSCDKTLW